MTINNLGHLTIYKQSSGNRPDCVLSLGSNFLDDVL